MTDAFIVRRRTRKASPMHSRRIGGFAAAGAAGAVPAGDFPGTDMPEPESGGRTVASALASALLHAAAIGALIFLASQVVEEVEEELITITLPKAAPEEPAPAPRVMAETPAAFAPAPMAQAPEIVNHRVIQVGAQPVQAAQITAAAVVPTVAPTQVAVQTVRVDQVSRIASPVTGTVAPVVPNYQGQSFKGPAERIAPVRATSGPRQIVRSGSTVGTGGPNSLGTGSSVRQGISSDRQVFGAETGQVANARTNIGDAGKRGPGGNGTAGAVTFEECMGRPEVQRYLNGVKDRTISRWTLPIGATTTRVTLSFKLDVAGSAGGIQFQQSGDNSVGASAVDALKAASPFDHMGDQVRCLANRPLTATFKNPAVVSN